MLNYGQIQNLIKLQHKNPEAFSEFKIRGQKDFQGVEVFDLVQQKLDVYRTFEIQTVDNKKVRLNDEQVSDVMFASYKSSLRKVVKDNI
jgi:hypothetical protein